jgi:hypothetical protein
VHFTENDAKTLFAVCCSTEDSTFVLVYLELLRDLVAQVRPVTPQECLWGLVQLGQRMPQSDIVALILIVLSDLPCEAYAGDHIGAVSLWDVMTSSVDLPGLFALVHDSMPRWPKLFEHVCCLALALPVCVGRDLLALLTDRDASAVIRSSPHWYLFPLLLALQTEDETDKIHLLQFLAAVARCSASTIRTIVHLLAYLVPLIQTSQKYDPVAVFLAEVNAFADDFAIFEVIQTLCAWNLLFHTPAQPANAALAAEWSASPFAAEMRRSGFVSPEIQAFSIKSLASLAEFLKMPMAFELNFGILIAPDGSFAQQRLADIVVALREVGPRSREAALVDCFVQRRINEVEIRREIAYVRNAFLDEWKMVVISTLIEIRSVVHMSGPPTIARDMRATERLIRSREQMRADRLFAAARLPAFSLQRSRAICRGFPVAHTRRRVSGELGRQELRGNCTVWILREKYECQIAIDALSLVICFQESGKLKNLPFDQLSEIFVRDELIFEIWTKNKRSYLISLHESPNAIVPALPISVQKLDRPWDSNFDYLLWLNRMSGRSFNDPTCYPVFPCFIADLEALYSAWASLRPDFCEPRLLSEISNLAHELENSAYVAPEFYCDPDSISLALPSWAQNAHEFVYRMRKLLESPAVTALLPSWIGGVWGPGMRAGTKHAKLFPATFPQRAAVPAPTARRCHMHASDSRIAFAFRDKQYMCVVNEQGNVLTYTLVNQSCVLTKEGTIPQSLSDVEFYPDGQSLLLYTRETRTLVEFEGGSEKRLSFEKGLFCRAGTGYVSCEGGCETWNTGKHIASSRARIVAFAVSIDCGRLVYGTAEGSLHFLTLSNGREVAEANFGGLIDSILITSQCEFVVVRGGANVRVFSVNGKLLQQAALPSEIVCWSTFTSYDGFDFIAFACLWGDVGFFEAFLPNEPTFCCRCPSAALVFYELDAGRMMILDATGMLQWVPQPLPKLA